MQSEVINEECVNPSDNQTPGASSKNVSMNQEVTLMPDSKSIQSSDVPQHTLSAVPLPNAQSAAKDAEEIAFNGIASAVTTLGDSVVQLSVALQELRKFSAVRNET